MAREKKQKVEVRAIEDILNNPSDRSKLENFIQEAVDSKTRIASENELIKDIKEDAKEKIGLDPSLFNDLVRISFKHDHLKTQEKISALDSAIEILFKDKD